jgi:hypothetical protein
MLRSILILLVSVQFIACDKNLESTNILLPDSTCYKGKLVLTGLCGNAVVQVLDDRMDTLYFEKTWKDESTGIVYNNVMGNLNFCSFPRDIKEGQEFYFSINPSIPVDDCARCKAISPSPEKRQYIQICGTITQ